MNNLRRDLPPLPRRMMTLPVDARGYPVPWFVAWIDGKPDFRAFDPDKLRRAIKFSKCWICGDRLGVNKAFVIGPMCIVNRVSGEPPAHHACAEFALLACPFITLPHAKRRTANIPEHYTANPEMLPHNPGAMALWSTRYFTPFQSHGSILCRIGDPDEVQWFAEGRAATRAECIAAFERGLQPLLELERERASAAGTPERAITEAEAFEEIAPYLPPEPPHIHEVREALPPEYGGFTRGPRR